MSIKPPRIGVVTVTYNSGAVLPDFLDSIAAQTGIDVRLYVVDNDSRDSTAELLSAESRIEHLTTVFNPRNLGVAVGNNQGIELALADECDWVLLLNNDTFFPSDTLASLARVASENNLDIVSPLIEATEPQSTIWYGGGHYVPLQGFRTKHDSGGRPTDQFPTELAKTGYASTCCLLVRPVVFHTVGLMDPVYFVYFDDVDFAVRCNKAGFDYWLTPEARIIHKASSLTGGKSSPFTVKWVSRNWPLIARRHLKRPQSLLALAFIQAWMLARLATGRDGMNVYQERQRSFREGVRAASAPAAPGVSVTS